jgi:hypothetical protein
MITNGQSYLSIVVSTKPKYFGSLCEARVVKPQLHKRAPSMQSSHATSADYQ